MMTAQIDVEAIKARADVWQFVDRSTLRRSSSTGGGEYSGPCPMCGGTDRFSVQPDAAGGARWVCRKCGDGKYHDVIELVQRLHGVGFVEACRLIAGEELPTGGKRPAPAGELAPRPMGDPPPQAWQVAALVAAHEAADELQRGYDWWEANADAPRHTWPAAAVSAWYLTTYRGLRRETALHVMLGHNEAWRQLLPPDGGHKGGYWLAPGVTIPSIGGAGMDLWYVNVRTTKEARAAAERRRRPLGKYHAATGSQLKSLYNANALLSSDVGVIVEGEFDALLLDQEAGDLASVATMGSAGTIADDGGRWYGYLGHLQRLYICLDPDEAGARGVDDWLRVFPHAVVIPPPGGPGEDLTDYWRAGGDLREWLAAALR